MNLKRLFLYCCILLSFSSRAQINVDDDEYTPFNLKGFNDWEKTMLHTLGSSVRLDPTSLEYNFVKAAQIKTVRKYLVIFEEDSTKSKHLQYTLSYDAQGNLSREKTSRLQTDYFYNSKGFLVDVQSKKINGPRTRSFYGVEHYREKHVRSNDFPFSKLQETIVFNKKDKASSYMRYDYLNEYLLSRINHYNSENRLSYFYVFEYEFYK